MILWDFLLFESNSSRNSYSDIFLWLLNWTLCEISSICSKIRIICIRVNTKYVNLNVPSSRAFSILLILISFSSCLRSLVIWLFLSLIVYSRTLWIASDLFVDSLIWWSFRLRTERFLFLINPNSKALIIPFFASSFS